MKKINVLETKIVDGRCYNNGKKGGNGKGRTAMAMVMIGKSATTSFSELTRDRERKNFWRAIDYLRGKTYSFNRVKY